MTQKQLTKEFEKAQARNLCLVKDIYGEDTPKEKLFFRAFLLTRCDMAALKGEEE